MCINVVLTEPLTWPSSPVSSNPMDFFNFYSLNIAVIGVNTVYVCQIL